MLTVETDKNRIIPNGTESEGYYGEVNFNAQRRYGQKVWCKVKL